MPYNPNFTWIKVLSQSLNQKIQAIKACEECGKYSCKNRYRNGSKGGPKGEIKRIQRELNRTLNKLLKN